jgi:hypothetical protein
VPLTVLRKKRRLPHRKIQPKWDIEYFLLGLGGCLLRARVVGFKLAALILVNID